MSTAPQALSSPCRIPFIHLHVQSAFSFGDGASSVESLVLRAAELGQSALAITDTMSVTGIPSLVRRAKQAGIRPIAGSEIVLEGGDRITLLADGPTGFASLCRILSAAGMRDVSREGMRARGEDLEANTDGLLCLTGAPDDGLLPRLLRRGEYDSALAALDRLCGIFGRANVFVEVTRTLAEGEHALSRRLLALADHRGLPAVATNAVRHAGKLGMAAHEALRRVALQLGPYEESGELPINAERYLKSAEAMHRLYPDRPDALACAVRLSERLAPPLDPAARHLPAYPKLPPGQSAFSYLCALTWQGARERYGRSGGGGGGLKGEVAERLIHELETIRDLGYADYYLVCKDVCDEARRREIGFALRGSAVGSAVAHCLGMSPHDPIRERVSFERFLSKSRKKPPDIDIDFRHDERDAIMEYTRETYGRDRVANVANYVTWRGRSLLRDLGKVLGFAGGELDRLRELLWHSKGDDLAERLAAQPELRALGLDPERYADLFALCASLAGLPRHLGTHSSGIVVSDAPLAGVAPLLWAAKGVPVVALDKDDVEAPGIGLLKMDQLSLRALTSIDAAVASVRKSDPSFDYEGRDKEDKETLALIRAAQTIGVFQLESPAQQCLQMRLMADSFDDLVRSVALIRPGPLLGEGVEAFLWRRWGWQRVEYPLPDLEPILSETYGRILWQDQVPDVVRVLGGYTADEADAWCASVKRCRSDEEAAPLALALKERAVVQGVRGKPFARLWRQIYGFARGFGFCHGHSLAFAAHAQGTAYLLARHPAEFLAAVLSAEPCGFWPVLTVAEEARRRGAPPLAPCVNRSAAGAWTVEAEAIRCSLAAVRSVGARAADSIVREREEHGPFVDLTDACSRLWMLDREQMEWLALAGALDTLCPSRREALWSLPVLHRGGRESAPARVRRTREAEAGQAALGGLEVSPPLPPGSLPEFAFAERYRRQFEAVGFSPEGHPVGLFYRRALSARGVLPCAALQEAAPGAEVRIAGLNLRPHRPPTLSGETMVFTTIEDETGLAHVSVSPGVYERCGAAIFTSGLLEVGGTVRRRGGGAVLSVNGATPL